MVNGLKESFLQTQLMEINGLTWHILSDALRIRKHAYDYETVVSGFRLNVEKCQQGKKEKLNLVYISCYSINYLNEIDHLVQIEIISIKKRC